MSPYIFSTVFLLSLSAIAMEILLARIFSITQWNHLSFMVISLALFGFAASGTAHSLRHSRNKGADAQQRDGYPAQGLAAGYTLSALAAVVILRLLPLDFFQLPLSPVQSVYLFISYAMLSIPFFFAGMANIMAYSAVPEKSAVVYAASMAGSAMGAALPALLIAITGEDALIFAAAALPAVVVFPVPSRTMGNGNAGWRWMRLFHPMGTGLALLAACLWFFSAMDFQSAPSPYKSMQQLLQFPDSKIEKTITTLRGRYDVTASPYIRFAPGLSLKYNGPMPLQSAVFKDADHRFVFYDPVSPYLNDFTRHLLMFIGYRLVPSAKNALIIPDGGGAAVACAAAAGLKETIVVHPSPTMANLLRNQYRMPVIVDNPVAFLSRTPQQFHLIQLESWGASLLGAGALDQRHLFTRAAFRSYYRALSENGLLVVSRRLMLPPADMLRLTATAYDAAAMEGAESPEHHLAILRNWDTYVLLLHRTPITDPSAINRFASELNFDLVFLPGLSPSRPNQFHRYDAPFHHEAVTALLAACRSGRAAEFMDRHPLDIAPQTDDRPFPGRFFKWRHLRQIYENTGSRIYMLFLSGEVMVAAVFCVALLLSCMLIVTPMWKAGKSKEKKPWRQTGFFFCVGAGFILVELFFIKSITWVLDDPVVSFSVVLSGMLIFSAAGALLSRWLTYARLPAALVSLVLWLLVMVITKTALFGTLLDLSYPWRVFYSLLILLPTGLLSGIPFPLAMQWMPQHTVQRAMAWAGNGCASVLAAVLAAQVAISIGIRWILILGLLAYLLAFCLSAHKIRRQP